MNYRVKRFEELKVEEIYNILKIRNEVFVVEQRCAYLDCDGKDVEAYHLYFEDNGEIVAYLRILEKGVSYDKISIGRVLVNKKYRGKGIARNLMLKAINFIEQDLNEIEIKISAQLYLLNFYKSIGFKEISDQYLEDDIPHIEMYYTR